MSGGNFFFPPPPPPPTSSSRSASEADGDANRGRDRGGYRGRGRGNGSAQGALHNPYRNHSSFGSNNNGQAVSTSPRYTSNTYRQGYQQHHDQSPKSSAPGTSANPSFPRQQNTRVANPPQVAQATPNYPPRTYAGHKRKLDALRPPSSHERNPRPETAPSLPSFGAPIATVSQARAPQSNLAPKTNSSATLGLVPRANGAHPDESDDEDAEDVDEEALYAELGTQLTFEHNGTVMSLKSAADLAAWKKERKRNWPTRARMAEREAERRKIGELRRRLLGVPSRAGGQWTTDFTKKKPVNLVAGVKKGYLEPGQGTEQVDGMGRKEGRVDQARRELAEQKEKLQALRQRVADSQALLDHKNQQAPMNSTNGPSKPKPKLLVDYSDEDDNDENQVAENAAVQNTSDTTSGLLSDSSVISPDLASEQDSDQDEPPEESSTKLPELQQAGNKAPICRYFAASGYCRDGVACQFRHGVSTGVKQERAKPPRPPTRPSAARSDGRKGIYQRLLEQQQEEEDRLALQVIKYLGKAGFFESASTIDA